MAHNAEELLKKYRENTCTPEERELVEQYFNRYVYRNDKMPTSDAYHMANDQIEQNVTAYINQASLSEARRLRYRIVAAAILILGLSISLYVYVYQTRYSNPPMLSQDVVRDVAPGGDRATLTLADGSIINLEEAMDGVLARQQGITIAKTEDGQIVYEVINEAPNSGEVTYNVISTPKGGQYQVILSDGTKVWLNAASSITYPSHFTGDRRTVTIEGEAYFEVRHAKDRPFIVKSGGQEVVVLGTVFNVNAYSPTVKTTLVSGAVQVSASGRDLMLQPGQQAILQTNRITKQQVNIADATAWRSGKFSFDNKTFAEIMDDLARWYDLDIVYEDGVPNDELSGDAFRTQNLRLVLRVLDALAIDYALDAANRKLTIKNKK